ncbi:DUF4406 domain-containing protein [Paracidovorax wautersii]|uniref:DUF4406 domain-containing protein n=1 Tax=Paracidovorax wautersii TaxID=1177982 RepID=A0A1I2GEX1_9BURK|nr:DUF4406 domain-containing protein [Paracidovorax wautersii]SFF15181.1 protein of unknown function [Paracidovorax wautersii]
MTHKICDHCETVQHCSQHGCIPPAPSKATHVPETLRLAAWLTEGAWYKMRLGDVEAAGREMKRLHEENKRLSAALDAAAARAATANQVWGDTEIDALCQPGRAERWKGDGRQYDRDTVRLVLAAAAPHAAGVQLAGTREGRIYVAGPMTDLPELNFPAFHAAAADLRARGLAVVNPAEHGIVEGAEWADYLHYDLGRLSTCSSIYLLPGWSRSRGAALEAMCAQTLGMRFEYAAGAERPALMSALKVIETLMSRTTLEQASEARRTNGLTWAVNRWHIEVSRRPLENVHRRPLDDAWRQVVRYFGGDPEELLGPSHDEIQATTAYVATSQTPQCQHLDPLDDGHEWAEPIYLQPCPQQASPTTVQASCVAAGHIAEPYTLAEIKAKIASGDYSAELMLQHAMLLLEALQTTVQEGAPSSLQREVLSKLVELARIVDRAVADWGESGQDGSSHVIFHKEEAAARDAILDYFDALPDGPDDRIIESGPVKADRVLSGLAPPASGGEAQAEEDARIAHALHAAVSAIYFDDSSTFKSALGRVVHAIDPALAGELLCYPKDAFDKSAAREAASMAAFSKEGGA